MGCVQALISPTTQMGRQVAHILLLLRRHLSADVEMLLSPAVHLDAMPLTAYYAYAAPEVPLEAATELAPVVASVDVPGHLVLTLNVEVPEAWLVEVPLSDRISMMLKCNPSAPLVPAMSSWIQRSRMEHRRCVAGSAGVVCVATARRCR